MFFHVDEAGNTGSNLFDANQPRFSYGVLSSKTNVDALGASFHKRMLKVLGEDQLHANALGVERLVEIAPLLLELHEKLDFRFDYFYIDKPAFAVVLLFDAVFDPGVNPGANWFWYWTPLRYAAVHHLAMIVDEGLLREAHRLCIAKQVDRERDAMIAVLSELRRRAADAPFQDRVREVFDAAFAYGIERPSELDFGSSKPIFVSPNIVAFQFVCGALAKRSRQRRKSKFTRITVDRQQQFNRAQDEAHAIQQALARAHRDAPQSGAKSMLGHPLYEGLDPEEVRRTGFPEEKINIAKSADSIGLQIVDVYLWLMNQAFDRAELPPELWRLLSLIIRRAGVDSISMEGMEQRFLRFEQGLPPLESMSLEQKERGQELKGLHDQRVHDALVRVGAR